MFSLTINPQYFTIKRLISAYRHGVWDALPKLLKKCAQILFASSMFSLTQLFSVLYLPHDGSARIAWWKRTERAVWLEWGKIRSRSYGRQGQKVWLVVGCSNCVLPATHRQGWALLVRCVRARARVGCVCWADGTVRAHFAVGVVSRLWSMRHGRIDV